MARSCAASNQVPESRVHPAKSTGSWVPWALLRLILEVLVPCKCSPRQLSPGTFSKGYVVEYYLLIPVFRSCEVCSAVSSWEDGLHQFFSSTGTISCWGLGRAAGAGARRRARGATPPGRGAGQWLQVCQWSKGLLAGRIRLKWLSAAALSDMSRWRAAPGGPEGSGRRVASDHLFEFGKVQRLCFAECMMILTLGSM